jgi:NTE family protein
MGRGKVALVLGGGGVTGAAWEIGILAGLAEAGVDVTGADLVIGTSAGSVVAARIATGQPLDYLYDEQVTPTELEMHSRMGVAAMLHLFGYMLLPGAWDRKRAWLGRAAARLDGHAPERIDELLAVLSIPQLWPSRRLLITAVEVETGRLRVFDSSAGVPLSAAVAASCAVPLVFPPVRINGHTYMDGGIPSPTNAGLARDVERVLVVAPILQAMSRSARVRSQLHRLGPGVARYVLSPDPAAVAAIGRDLMDVHHAGSAARAGRAQGVAAAEAVGPIWLEHWESDPGSTGAAASG